MKNIMVCVTQQKSCDRLIKFGKHMGNDGKSELYIIHVASKKGKFLNGTSDTDALDYLYEKANDAGAHLTVVRATNVLEALLNIVDKNKITHVVMGTSGKVEREEGLIEVFQKKVEGKAEVTFLPPEELQEDVG